MAQGGGSSATGIRGRITPDITATVVHLERDDGSGFVEIGTFGPGQPYYDFEDLQPLDGIDRDYRFYETTNLQTSADSSPVTGKPTTLGGPL